MVRGKIQLITGALYLQGSLLKPKSIVMSKKFQLQIPEPCHEDWNKMTPGDKGRFCDSCQKTVHDFTGMSDAQLIAFFKKPSTGSICGRFYNDQLERDFEIPRKRLPWVKYFFQFAIPMFLSGIKSYSQGNPILKENIVSVCPDTITKNLIFGNSIPLTRNETVGKVVDETGRGIPYATVLIKGTKNGTMSDSSGFFQFENPAYEKKITIIVSSVGYTTTEKQINVHRNDFNEITLTTNTFLSGEVVVSSTVYTRGRIKLGGAVSYKIQKPYIQKVKDYFFNDSIKVFPNPVKAGSQIKIECKKAETAEYKIDLYSLQGQLVKSSLARMENKINVFAFEIPIIIPGSYLLRLTNEKSGKKHTEKIIIQ